MDELLDLNPTVLIPEAEYKRLLGYPAHYKIDDRVRELIDKTKNWYAEHGRPWVYIRQAEKLEWSNGAFRIEGVEFTSKRLYDYLANAEADKAILVAVSAGKACEAKALELWQEEKPDEYFFMEMYGSSVVENLITTTGARLCAWADEKNIAVLPHYSPGYPEWDIAQQNKLFDLIRGKNTKAEFPQELFVMESGMLNPKKSLLAVFGVTEKLEKVQGLKRLVPCENCSLESCSYRRVPYKRAIQVTENISSQTVDNKPGQPGDAVLNHNASYKINSKALDKWVKERLSIITLEDGSYEVQFKYDGTTCSNTGRPLQFHYRIKIAPADDDYKILEAHCYPAPGDTGHKFMCQYTKDAKQLMSSIENEKPLLGKPLNAVLDWKYASNPAACYCASASREHKWGIVLQVIHYALVQREKQAATV